jgi:UDP-glucose 4-epimerase
VKKILVTGGAGYIGSHTVLQLLEQDYQVVVLDNLSNSHAESLNRVKRLTQKELVFVQGDIRDEGCLEKLFSEHKIDAVIHFAGLKAVGESVQMPLEYYHNNVYGTLTLCTAMRNAGVKNLVFSSSATVYGDPVTLPLSENLPTGTPTNPYGMSKLMVEHVLSDTYKSDDEWNVVVLRYFNPVGAHESGEIGEDPNGIPNNLMPYISQVASGKLQQLSVFGDDYDTPDGTGVRDYIHVVDLAAGHLRALDRLALNMGYDVYNLGTGQGYSVLEMVSAFEKACGKPISYKIAPRREGDVASCYADPTLAAKELNWHASLTLEDMCSSTWKWQSANPMGFN